MENKVQKHTSETYHIRNAGEWAYFTICTGLGLIQVQSAFGSYAFCWPQQRGDEFKEFLADDGDTDYALMKLCTGHMPRTGDRKFEQKLLKPFFDLLQKEMRGEPLELPQPRVPAPEDRSEQLALI